MTALKCIVRGGNARGPIRVDGRDACPCVGCQTARRLEGATGVAQASAEGLNLALGYLTVHPDPAEARRQIRLARYSLGEIAHTLKQVLGTRPLDEPFEMDPDWIEQDLYQEGIASTPASSTEGGSK